MIQQRTKILWEVPKEVEKDFFDKLFLYRSNNENFGYNKILEANISPPYPDSIDDSTEGHGRNKFYLVTFYNSERNYETPFILTFFEPLPREMRLISILAETVPPVVARVATRNTYLASLKLGFHLFNIIPPQTQFSIYNLPENLEIMIIWGAMANLLILKYLPVSIRDFDYSVPGGLSLRIDRGEKIREAINTVLNSYDKIVRGIKFDYVHGELGLGTIQLPLSLGGMIARGITNLLNVFQVSF